METLVQAISEIVGVLAGLLPRWDRQLEQTERMQTLEAQRVASGGIKPDPPAEFDGSESKVNGFVDECSFYLESLRVTNDRDKIIWALSKVRGGTNGKASAWADLQRNNMQIQSARQRTWDQDTSPVETKGARPPEQFANWETFVSALRHEFSVRDDRGSAIEAIRKIEQGNRSCDEYATEFCTIMH